MFGGIKKMLGIEGVKIDVEVFYPINKKEQLVKGKVKLTTLRESTIIGVAIKLIEKYHRGRKGSKLIDEYVIGFVELDQTMILAKDDIVEIPFELPFKIYESQMDKMQNSNIFAAGLVFLAKTVKGVKSEFRIEAEAIVTGTKLNPLSKKDIIMK
jgi:hypothetical protein